ncbi:putative mitochondrial protein [Cucumis melo var. makuwa]|uniref:Mitochondrial protein n=1 Tax=Cucumis melo var. makuwa TaxID=1194695 RepID=A0A5A7VA33_CUCMM|nr:putative mitochondrial protein [Cucumis melo var. makuwa]TYK08829.1 putative mitochondrial protein [Cucumis melo var. makuwa]
MVQQFFNTNLTARYCDWHNNWYTIGCDESTSRCQMTSSIRVLGSHQPVIPNTHNSSGMLSWDPYSTTSTEMRKACRLVRLNETFENERAHSQVLRKASAGPRHFRCHRDGPVSYYAFFKGWLLPSPPLGCHRSRTSFSMKVGKVKWGNPRPLSALPQAIDIIRFTEIDFTKNQLYSIWIGLSALATSHLIFYHIHAFDPPRPVRALFNLLMARSIDFGSNRKNKNLPPLESAYT